MSPRTVQDAVTAAGVLHAMLRHPDKIGMANYVFLLNGNGVILVNPEGTVKTPLFDVFALYHRLMTGEVIEVRTTSDTVETTLRAERIGQERQQEVELVDIVAVRNADSGAINVAIVNRHRDEPAEIVLDGLAGSEVTIHELTHDDPLAANTFEHPDTVRAVTRTAAWTGNLTVPAHSVALLEFEGSLSS
jgi:alpha-N-arabinofuranosidase